MDDTQQYRLELTVEVYNTFFSRVGSFKQFGMQLAYLLGGLATGDGYDLWSHDPITPYLQRYFPEEHRIWKHIVRHR